MNTIKFYAKRKIFFTISLIILLIGVAFTAIQGGVKLDIQFSGGSVLKYTYEGELDQDKVDDVVTKAINREVNIQLTTDPATQIKKVSLNLAGNQGLTTEDQQKLIDALNEGFADNKIALSESSVVEPFIGKRFLMNAMWAIIISFILVVLYVWYSFRKIGGLSAGVMAVLALIHDVMVVLVTFIVFRIPLDENFMTAALTIIGFSVNDTIVIYDRIRENTLFYGRKMEIEELVDKSITQSLTRSINTNVAVFVSIAIVYVFTELYGLNSMRSFALPMMVGVISGCYSTICLAGPLWVMWKKHKLKEAAVK